MFNSIFDEFERIILPIALTVFTAFIGWLFTMLRAWFGVEKSQTLEEEIRRAALTEAGKLVANSTTDPASVAQAASKITSDLASSVKIEGYTVADIADMITGNFPIFGLIKRDTK